MVNLISSQEHRSAVWSLETSPSVGFPATVNPCCGRQRSKTEWVNLSSWKSFAFHPRWSSLKVSSMSYSACASLHIWESKRYQPYELSFNKSFFWHKISQNVTFLLLLPGLLLSGDLQAFQTWGQQQWPSPPGHRLCPCLPEGRCFHHFRSFTNYSHVFTIWKLSLTFGDCSPVFMFQSGAL